MVVDQRGEYPMVISRNSLEKLIKQKSVASSDVYRIALQGTQWIEDKLLTADGHIASQIIIQDRTDAKIFFNISDLDKIKAFLKLVPKHVKEFSLDLPSKTLTGGAEKIFLALEAIDTPDIQKVLEPKALAPFTFGLNYELLCDLSKAIAGKNGHIRLTIDTENKLSPIAVTGDEGAGVIMPIRI